MAGSVLLAVGAFVGYFSPLASSARFTLSDFVSSLDTKTAILHPGTAEFSHATSRWNAAQAPQYDFIVRVSTEKDVQKTILYANANKKPFFTISGGHGTTSIVNGIRNGIGIHVGGMSNITIVDDGSAALIQGGVVNGDLIPYLWSHGKQTTTTGCDCVGYIAPILGGGHGWLQGRYGLAADQLISARMVLGNGTIITVDEESNPDLFWAIRGAGHNFGVVTQVKLKIYERKPEHDQWAASGFVFTHDKMESVFALANEWLQSPERPIEMTHYGVFAHNPEIDPVNPVVMMWIYWQGAAIPSKYTAPLYALSPTTVDESITDLAGVNTHLQATRDGASCAKGFSRSLVPITRNEYSLPALRKVIDIFTAMAPEFRTSVMMLEGYALQEVVDVPIDSTAVPNREGKLLLSPILTYPRNASLDSVAMEIGRNIKDAVLEGTGVQYHAYVNYARGDESMEEMYGYESWRLEKLRGLKRQYDPHGRFNFYAPIV